MMSKESHRLKVLLIGTIAGAITGLSAAYLLLRGSEEEEKPAKLTPSQGVKIGLMLLGVLREVARLSEEN
jgi:hypothetical protein